MVACIRETTKGSYRSLKAISLQSGAYILGTSDAMFILPVYLCIVILPTLRVVIPIQRNSQLQYNCHTDPMQLSAQKLGLKEVVGNSPRSWKLANGTMAKPGCKILPTKSTTFWASGRGSGAVNSNRMTTSATTTTPNNIHCNAMFEFLWPLTKPESVSCQFHTHKKLNNLALWQYNQIHITLQLHEHYTTLHYTHTPIPQTAPMI